MKKTVAPPKNPSSPALWAIAKFKDGEVWEVLVPIDLAPVLSGIAEVTRVFRGIGTRREKARLRLSDLEEFRVLSGIGLRGRALPIVDQR